MNKHTFHIPVMGIGFTVDTPVKVAHLGIDSVISLIDDILIEKMRKFYSHKFNFPYKKISEREDDFRAKRITSYLNLVKNIAEIKLEKIRESALNKREEFDKYLELLPSSSNIIKKVDKIFSYKEKAEWLKNNLSLGSIDVNIMTKVDKSNFRKGKQLPVEYNDAHAALRGFMNSDLESSVVLSAGMNPRLYNYLGTFPDFFPNKNGTLKKKIVVKVSDYRSALIQGKYLAKNGIWVSEFRIESGLNCGGHAFATDGVLLGPVLEDFKNNRHKLHNAMSEAIKKYCKNKGKEECAIPTFKITVQGGVGTSEEHKFLIDHYGVDSVGWGTPFLLVPEVTTVDKKTRSQLAKAKENDLYLSGISPLGVPFNNLRGNTKDIEKDYFISKGTPGSPCPKKYVKLNYEYEKEGLCTASRKFQKIKIDELNKQNLTAEEYKRLYYKITEKSCICVGLGTSALVANDLDTRMEGKGISICPGPNMAYFSKELSLKNMCEHIYGKDNIVDTNNRPQMFLKELRLYLDYWENKIKENALDFTLKQEKYLNKFADNLISGISYYENVFGSIKNKFEHTKEHILKELKRQKQLIIDASK